MLARKAICDKCNHVFAKHSKPVVVQTKKHKLQVASALQSSNEKQKSREAKQKAYGT